MDKKIHFDILKEWSSEVVLFFAVLMEIPIIMIPLSRLLNRKNNRLAHFIAVPLSILWIVIPSILSSETPLSYIFFSRGAYHAIYVLVCVELGS